MDYNTISIYKLLQTAKDKGVIKQFTFSCDGELSIKMQALENGSFEELNVALLDDIVDRLKNPEDNEEVNEAVEDNIR